MKIVFLFLFFSLFSCFSSSTNNLENAIISERQNGSYIEFGLNTIGKPISFLKETELKSDSPILYASISKIFISVSFLKLVELGKVSIEDNISKFYPKVKASLDCSIKNVLLHRCGLKLSEYPVAEFEEKDLNSLINVEKKNTFLYSNIGYVLLDDIIKKLGYVPSELVKLAQFNIDKGINCLEKKLIPSYELDEGIYYREVKTYTMPRYGAAGNYCGTPESLIKWTQLLFRGEIINANSMKTLLETEVDNIGMGAYFFSKKKEVIFFRGDMDGFMLQISFDLKKNKGILFVANSTSKYHFRSYNRSVEYLLGKRNFELLNLPQSIKFSENKKIKPFKEIQMLKILAFSDDVLTILFKNRKMKVKYNGHYYYNPYEDIAISFQNEKTTIQAFGNHIVIKDE